MNGPYEAVHAHPDGNSTVSRLALTASEYGYDGIVVRNHGGTPSTYDPTRIARIYDIDVVTGVEVRADSPARASGFIGSHREDQTIVLVHGGDTTLNRFAVEQAAVDVLAHPLRGDGDFNHVLAREAKKQGVRIELSLAAVLDRSGGQRVQTLQDLRKLGEIIREYDVPYVVSGDPSGHLQLRAPRELRALGEVIGFSGEEITAGLEEWSALANRNRERQSNSYVQPGVTRVPADGTDDSSRKSGDETEDSRGARSEDVDESDR